MANDKKLIVGNWKMNLGMHEASLHVHKLEKMIKTRRDVEIVLAPTSLTLQSLSLQVKARQFKLAAQNFYWRDHGAYTGEISASQLRGIVQYGIIGHSERRHIFGETDKDVRNKVGAAIRNNIRPILCVGETAWERAANETLETLHDHIVGGLSNVTSDEVEDVVLAYEPVWAIGTGQGAHPMEVKSAIAAMRDQVKHLFGNKAAENIQVLYGGSVTIDNAADYLDIEGVDGLLIGGASLDAHKFAEIVKKAHASSQVTKR
jgi:triosephosphate isomerase